jgi:hypothetical protein
VPHQQAGHMTAPDQCCINVKRLLSIRRRPHMTQSRHAIGRNTAVRLAAEPLHAMGPSF